MTNKLKKKRKRKLKKLQQELQKMEKEKTKTVRHNTAVNQEKHRHELRQRSRFYRFEAKLRYTLTTEEEQ